MLRVLKMYPLLVVKIISQQLKNTNQGVWLQIIKNVCKVMCNTDTYHMTQIHIFNPYCLHF